MEKIKAPSQMGWDGLEYKLTLIDSASEGFKKFFYYYWRVV
jgi:hypothetical protein